MNKLKTCLTLRLEYLAATRSRLENEESFLEARSALKLLTNDERLRKEDIFFDLQAIQEQVQLINQALALTQ